MRVVQVYLPTVLTDTVVYNGFAQPLLRYYERLIATHVTPVLYKDISRSGWEKFVDLLKKSGVRVLRDISYDRALVMALAIVLYALARKYSWAQKAYKQLVKWGERYKLPKESFTQLESEISGSVLLEAKDDEKMFTEVIIDKDKVKIQFIAIPLTVDDVRKLFTKFKSNEYIKSAKEVMFSSLTTLDIYDQVDIKALVLTVPCVICSIEEVEDIKAQYANKQFSMIVVDTVNEVVYAKLVLYGKEFKYSTPLAQVIKTRYQTDITLDRLASVLQGVKLGGAL